MKSSIVAETFNPIGAAVLQSGLARSAYGRFDLAQRDLEEAVQRDSAFVGAWAALGNVYARQGRVDEAIESYESELAFNPSSVEGHVNLAVQLVKLSRLDEPAGI